MVTSLPTWSCNTRKLWRSAERETSAQLGRVSMREDVRVVANFLMITPAPDADEAGRVTRTVRILKSATESGRWMRRQVILARLGCIPRIPKGTLPYTTWNLNPKEPVRFSLT